jgi:riboflavin biosynthesis pyrimidine reductase
MVPSIDGRIVLRDWPVPPALLAVYERTAATFGAEAWIIGRISMEPYAGRARIPTYRGPRIPRVDFVPTPAEKGTRYAIAIDPQGKLRWSKSRIDDEHVIAVLTERVSDAYLAFLRARGVAYVFGGARTIDLPRVLATLRARFGIRTLLLEGGGKINGHFHAADLVDELSVLIAPLVDGSVGTPTLVDAPTNGVPARGFRLTHVARQAHGVVWLRYARAPTRR